ncbi:MAG: hypothetical protein JWO38_945 [Gemmataceae bacterium]|nr:hypothetical protein [Gemmataceae bacterium]
MSRSMLRGKVSWGLVLVQARQELRATGAGQEPANRRVVANLMAVSIIRNHIPNVTQFPTIREAYLEFVSAWLG